MSENEVPEYTFDEWLATFPALFYVRVPTETWHAMTRENKNRMIAHNKAVEEELDISLADASVSDAFVTFAADIWKSFPTRLRQKVTALNTDIVNEMCDSQDILTIPTEVWRVLSPATRKEVIDHNRAILDERRADKNFSGTIKNQH